MKVDAYMDCRDKILSDDYVDIVVDFPVDILLTGESDICYIPLGDGYSVVFDKLLTAQNRWKGPYQYRFTPKVYGLMELDITAPRDNMQGKRRKAGEMRAAQLSEEQSTVSEPVARQEPYIAQAPFITGEPFDPTPLISSGILSVQRDPLKLTGKGCIFCCIDTGVDYVSPVFRNEDGTTRILAIWDQTIQDGVAPEELNFGTVYTREQINEALLAEDPYSIVPSRDELGHGSALAGVAAGSSVGNGTLYLGAAPEADILVIKLKQCKPYLRQYYFLPDDVPAYTEADVMLAIKYANSFAETFKRPVVICLGVGTNMGDHNGNSFLSRYLSCMGGYRSRVMVVAGGNEGNAAHHFFGQIPTDLGRIDSYRDVEVRVAEGVNGFIMEFWGSVPDLFNIAIRSPGGETIPPIRLGVEGESTHRFIYERTVITIQSVLVEANTGEQLVLFRIYQPTAGIWNFRVSAAGQLYNGSFHLWLPITDFITADCYFLSPDPYTTLTEPSMADRVICVSTYNDANNSFFLESGRGFARMGQICPDIAAPGVNISTLYGRRTGSSLAAALTAGAAAQFMQWAVVEGNSLLAETEEVRNYFIQGAVRSTEVSYPSREWGESGIIVSSQRKARKIKGFRRFRPV